MILTLRTDKPEAEIGLFDARKPVEYQKWQAHRELAETIHDRIRTLLQLHGKDWADVTGIVIYKGPGSFTGLRIGITVANALAYSNKLPIVGTMGERWVQDGLMMLENGKDDHLVTPEYGADVHITPPKA
jgi:tRNA threonylcarbamoyladenosine biosynthesis protein TsaB